MRFLNRITATILIAGSWPILPVSATGSGIYQFDLSTGMFPSGTEVVNLNGVLPEKDVYKHGYTESGWTVDRLDNRGYVALSPTYTGTGTACDNRLMLPPFDIDEPTVLSWETKSVYRHFPESYRVMVFPENGGEPRLVAEVKKESYFWTRHEISLPSFKGEKVRIGFVCTSENGYMLALTGIKTGESDSDPTGSADQDLSSENGSRKLVVDRGTGMWCVNCPTADVAIESLREQYGSNLIVLNTHVRDILDNSSYWEELDWYSIPKMMLNRIKATEGDNTKKFKDFLKLPTSFVIEADAPQFNSDGKAKTTVRVTVAEEIDNSSDRYRIGGVLVADFHQPDKDAYAQKNNCSFPAYGAYYFLPTEIPAKLMYYDDVTLSSSTAFSGVAESLPKSLKTGESYDFEMQIEADAHFKDFTNERMVVFILDTSTGEILNATVAGTKDDSGISLKTVPQDQLKAFVGSDRIIRTSLRAGEPFMMTVNSVDGSILLSASGTAEGNDAFRIPDTTGILLIRLSSPRGVKTFKHIISI